MADSLDGIVRRTMNVPQPPSDAAEIERFQRWFQTAVTHPGGVAAGLAAAAISDQPQSPDPLACRALPSSRLSAEARLEIYAGAYFARLLECLRAEFPILLVAAGQAAFDDLALGYLRAYPSRSYTLNRLGDRLARYLRETRPPREAVGPSAGTAAPPPDWADLLAELAELEWAINETFDGPGSEQLPPLDAAALAAFAAAAAELRIALCPSLRLIRCQFPLHEYYSQLKHAAASSTPSEEAHSIEVEAISPPPPAESYLALVRRQYVVWRYPLTGTQYALLEALRDGAALTEAIARAAERLPADEGTLGLAQRLEAWFRHWTAAGIVRGVAAAPTRVGNDRRITSAE